MTDLIVIGSSFVPVQIIRDRLKKAGFIVIELNIKNYRDDVMGMIDDCRPIESTIQPVLKPKPVPLSHPVTKKGKKGKRKKDWD